MNNKILADGIEKICLNLDDNMVSKLELYVDLLLKWNKTYSLTAITRYDDVIRYHILDGLTLINYLNQMADINSLIDIGSGMGVPGVIIAICKPQINVVLLDSSKKKTAFLQQVAIELNLKNLKVVTSRVEEYVCINKFDINVSRAFTDTQTFIKLSEHLLKYGGKFLLMKSRLIDKELTDSFKYNYRKIQVKIPDVNDERILLEIDNR